MELNYLRVDFIILFLNGVVSYLVNVMLDHIMVARIHPNPCILTTIYIWLIHPAAGPCSAATPRCFVPAPPHARQAPTSAPLLPPPSTRHGHRAGH